ncbi:hypothetical protein, partial [Burkholderia gladioli]|uniref:hypothetical protein n=1 Tax=Burkholderia gladioli TaxID=28095 RepID=UPI001C61696A
GGAWAAGVAWAAAGAAKAEGMASGAAAPDAGSVPVAPALLGAGVTMVNSDVDATQVSVAVLKPDGLAMIGAAGVALPAGVKIGAPAV